LRLSSAMLETGKFFNALGELASKRVFLSKARADLC